MSFKNMSSENILKLHFSSFDYVIFLLCLLISVLIGAYYAFFGKKQTTMADYLLAGRTMKVAPIAMSIIATAFTPTILIPFPAEIYRNGATISLCIPMKFLAVLYLSYVHLPVFFNSEVSTAYEYLEKRFDARVRKLGSFFFSLALIIFLPFILLISSLTLSAAIGLSNSVVALILCGTCAFYTAFGGIRAVIWTDVFQFLMLLGSVLTVSVCGLNNVGGFSNMWTKTVQGQRLDVFDFDPDPTKRDSFWIVTIGFFFTWLCEVCVNQAIIIKFLSVPTYAAAKKSAFLLFLGVAFVQVMEAFMGLMVYVKYEHCDPVMAKIIDKYDQIISYFVMDVSRDIPGLPGIFVAGIVCAGLSTLSPDLNGLAGSLYEDFVGKYLRKRNLLSPGIFIKMNVILVSAIILALALVFQKFDGLLSFLMSFRGIFSGPLMGLFVLGTLFPKANSKGAFYGGIIGITFLIWFVAMTKYYEISGVKYHSKPLSVDGCGFNVTKQLGTMVTTTKPFFLFRISFYYTALIGLFVTITSGSIISYFSNQNETPVDRKLLSPAIHFLLPKATVLRYESVCQGFQVETSAEGKPKK